MVSKLGNSGKQTEYKSSCLQVKVYTLPTLVLATTQAGLCTQGANR